MAGIELPDLAQECLVRVFHFLPIKQRSRCACVCRSWRAASGVDAVQVKLLKQAVPSYLHVALPDGAAQLQAASCPLMSLARSADVTWSSAAATGQLLESMPSLERLAFTSMSSVPHTGLDGALEPASGLQSLRSLTNLHSLQLNIDDAAPVLEAVPLAPALRELELHLTGDNWQVSVFDKIANQLGSQAHHLRSLLLRCSHAAVYAATEPLESLASLTGLTSLRMGPNPEDQRAHVSPLGFARLPSFLGGMGGLQHLDISMADSAAATSLAGVSLDPISHVPDVRLTLRADTSIRAVQQLPASIARVGGLSSLKVQAFTFEDAGGWSTHGVFDLRPLVGCGKLRELELQLGVWEAEHCEAFELPGLSDLSQLVSLKVSIASRFAAVLGRSAGGAAAEPPAQEVLLALPAMRPAHELHVASTMRVVLRNSKVLARALSPGVLAHSIALEEPLPQRKPAAVDAVATAAATAQQQQQQQQQEEEEQPQQQYVRAAAYVVISALRDLWPGIEVWQYPMQVPGLSSWQHVTPELLCKAAERDDLQQALWQVLVAGAAAAGDPAAADEGRRGRAATRRW